MEIKRLFILVIMNIICIDIYSNDSYYYAFDKQISITLMSNKLALHNNDNLSNELIENTISKYQLVGEWMNNNLYIIENVKRTSQLFSFDISEEISCLPVYLINDMEAVLFNEIILSPRVSDLPNSRQIRLNGSNFGYGDNRNAYFILDTIIGKSFEKPISALDVSLINLTSGFHTEPGCNLYITIEDMPCQESESISAIQKRIKDTSYKDAWCNQWNVLSHMSLQDATTWIYRLGEDTIINHQTYSTLNVHYSQDENIGFYIGALRFTDDQKIYIHYEDGEYLLYDFNVQVGDVIEVFSGIQNYRHTHTYTHTITDVATREDGIRLIESEIELCDGINTLKVKKQWIEGVGSTDGIVHNVSSLMESGVSQVLLCAYRGDECVYTTDDPMYMPLGCVYNGEESNSAVENNSVSHSSVQKIIHNGQLLILHDGKTYNIIGMEVGE